MRFATFETREGVERLGLLTSQGQLADLQGAFASRLCLQIPPEKACDLAAVLAPPEIVAFLDGGDVCLEAARQALAFVEEMLADGKTPVGPAQEKILFEPAEVSLKAPIPRPRKIICAGKNFLDHVQEMSSRGNTPQIPVAFPKVPSVVMSPEGRIPYPVETAMLDYEVEMAIIIGKRGWKIRKEQAFDHVFGYTVFNDISARDMVRAENQQGIFLLGKNLPGFAPMGPYLCSRDEIEDPQSLRLQCRVNGQIRQDSNLGMMMFKIDEMIAYWSQVGLEPGDILTTGTPTGVAAGRSADKDPWWLKKGDIVEAEVETIGILRTYIA
ncbi:MAG TPA: fumarylacetoacetate hydrolase family protein [bacterium]|nr:fumarylacetoacetate hydrolase family protein [bacterium]